ncbi:MAG: methyltransferase domain-containing protein [Pseudomonadota bacterium]
MSTKFFDNLYTLGTPDETEDLYQKWAATYEDEVAKQGYVTPGRVAAALWSVMPHPQTPVLDYGCGTGLSGLALKQVGFEVIDGIDPTPNMIREAESKGLYRSLSSFDITDRSPLVQNAYRLMTAIGVIGPGAAPPQTLDMLMHALPKDGILAFSFNDHTLADHTYTSRLNEWLDMGAARLLFREHGPHLPGINLKSDVYVIEKT